MSKFFGQIGFSVSTETVPGVWDESVTERNYYGDVTKNYRRLEGNEIIEDINISNQISIVADPYAYENFQHMKYIRWMGAEWTITSIDVQYPRLNLSIGGVYNGQTAPKTPSGAP